MFCTKCGQKNEDEAKFCIKCGSVLVNINDIQAASTQEENEVEQATQNSFEAQPIDEIRQEEPVVEEPVVEKTVEEPVMEEPVVEESTFGEEPEKEPELEETGMEQQVESLETPEPAVEEPAIEEQPIEEQPTQFVDYKVEVPTEQVNSIPEQTPVQAPVQTAEPIQTQMPIQTQNQDNNTAIKVKGFKSIKFSLGLLTILFSVIAGATMLVDMFIVHYEESFVNAAESWDYIKGTDIFKMINDFGDFEQNMKNFVIVSVAAMIIAVAVALIQFFVTILWRSRGGYVFTMFTSVIAIVAEAASIVLFFQYYVSEQYDAVGMVGYGPVIAIVLHIAILIIANVTRKLTKINSIVNR